MKLKNIFSFLLVLLCFQLGMAQATIKERPTKDKYLLQYLEVDKDTRIVQFKKELADLDVVLKNKNLSAQHEATDLDYQRHVAIKRELKALREQLVEFNKQNKEN